MKLSMAWHFASTSVLASMVLRCVSSVAQQSCRRKTGWTCHPISVSLGFGTKSWPFSLSSDIALPGLLSSSEKLHHIHLRCSRKDDTEQRYHRNSENQIQCFCPGRKHLPSHSTFYPLGSMKQSISDCSSKENVSHTAPI